MKAGEDSIQEVSQVDMTAERVESTREEWMLRPVARCQPVDPHAEVIDTKRMEDKGWGVDLV